ncbi:MAG: hypothetical protein AB1898_20175 [Acidobacteriota bacterium]
MISKDSYPGDSGGARVDFSMAVWIQFQKHLVTTEVVMRSMASRGKLRFLSNIHGDWPARRLRRQKIFGYVEITLGLNPNYAQDHQVFYLLTRREVRRFLGSFQRLLDYREIRRCSVEEIDDPDFVSNLLQSVV